MIEFTIEELQHMMIIMNGEDPYCGVCGSIRLKLEAMIKDKDTQRGEVW